ncbi:transcriptional regulator, AraC family [Paenibacillus curdlanolyticus YK9]|uniref:Transcriptional regulator, AraC family n=1 Tax=Paenibacillus curdlanolyticus YK9 TaxID=717606 RepID=E0I7D0_9BACL|nr:AraC family transcriptional regulator [Paenibacillus curdlanolyticus]EFM11946.1 transcriptional regulator, AraC family [Paenibacillus curdlanolyticus YK9]
MDIYAKHSLREDRLHGDAMLPLAAYWIDRDLGEPVLDTHWHQEAEFFCVLEGEVQFQVDTEYLIVRAGEAVFINGGDIHAGHAQEGAICRFCAIVFDVGWLSSASYDAIQASFITPLQERRRTFPRHIRSDTDWGRSVLGHLAAIRADYEGRSPGYEAAMKGRMLLIFHAIAAAGQWRSRAVTSAAESAKIERLKAIIVHIQRNFDRPLRIQELADLVPMSEGQFIRFFKSMTRKTPIEYVNTYRIRRAAELLRNTDRKISDIALEVGFDHMSYFIKVFRKQQKTTPSEYRKESSRDFAAPSELE